MFISLKAVQSKLSSLTTPGSRTFSGSPKSLFPLEMTNFTRDGIGNVVTMDKIMMALKNFPSSKPISLPIAAAANVADNCGTVIKPAANPCERENPLIRIEK